VCVEAVLFDLDGVLVHTDLEVLDLWRRVCADQGVSWAPERLRRAALGTVPERTIHELFPAAGQRQRAAILSQVALAEQALVGELAGGAAALLGALGRHGIPVAVVTGASRERAGATIARLGASAAVGAVVAWGDTERGKPSPDPYLEAARRLGADPAGCLVIEDSPAGVAAGAAAGARCVGIGGPATAPTLLSAGAALVVPDLRNVALVSGAAPAIVCTTREGRHVMAVRAPEASRTGGVFRPAAGNERKSQRSQS
jgi:sugar-phosphatase